MPFTINATFVGRCRHYYNHNFSIREIQRLTGLSEGEVQQAVGLPSRKMVIAIRKTQQGRRRTKRERNKRLRVAETRKELLASVGDDERMQKIVLANF